MRSINYFVSITTAAALVATLSTSASAAEPREHGSLETTANLEVRLSATSDATISDLAPEGGAVEVSQILQSSSDNSATINFELPSGADLVAGPTPRDGGFAAVDASGNLLFAVAESEIVDANGRPVEAAIDAEAGEIVITAETADAVYPLTVTTAAIGDLVARVTTERVSQGTIYKVQPSAYGRAAAEWIHAAWGWKEAVRKGVPDRKGLMEQYMCHPVSQVARVKSTWNLDSWRPTAGMAKTIAALCNP